MFSGGITPDGYGICFFIIDFDMFIAGGLCGYWFECFYHVIATMNAFDISKLLLLVHFFIYTEYSVFFDQVDHFLFVLEIMFKG